MSKSISRVLYWTVIYLRYAFLHTSSHPVRRRASLTLIGVLHQVGFTRLQGLPCTGELLPRLFILTNSGILSRGYIGGISFCCTFLRVASTGSYPAPCSVMLGLSSFGALLLPPATVWSTHDVYDSRLFELCQLNKGSFFKDLS